MNYTTYYKLQKPLGTEQYDIEVHNANADVIDAVLNKLEQKDDGQVTVNTQGIQGLTTRVEALEKNDITVSNTISSINDTVDAYANKINTLNTDVNIFYNYIPFMLPAYEYITVLSNQTISCSLYVNSKETTTITPSLKYSISKHPNINSYIANFTLNITDLPITSILKQFEIRSNAFITKIFENTGYQLMESPYSETRTVVIRSDTEYLYGAAWINSGNQLGVIVNVFNAVSTIHSVTCTINFKLPCRKITG